MKALPSWKNDEDEQKQSHGCDGEKASDRSKESPKGWNNQKEPKPKSAKDSNRDVRCVEYDMREFLAQCVTSYKELSGKKGVPLKKVATPFIEESLLPDGQEVNEIENGVLSNIASKVLMKILYAARMARFDLLRPVCALASCISRWSVYCDKMLHRLVSYINCTLDFKLTAYIGDNASNLELVVFADADLAGCKL